MDTATLDALADDVERLSLAFRLLAANDTDPSVLELANAAVKRTEVMALRIMSLRNERTD